MQAVKSEKSRSSVPRTVVLVSPDASFRHGLAETLTGMRWLVQEAAGGAEALCCLQETMCEALLLDSWLPDLEAGDFASQLRLQYPQLDLIRVDEMLESTSTPRSSRRNELLHALRRMQDSAGRSTAALTGNFGLPINLAPRGLRSPLAHGISPAGAFLSEKSLGAAQPELPARTRQENSVVKSTSSTEVSSTHAVEMPGMIGGSAAMQNLAHRIQLVAPRKTTVLIEGPTGTGKELVAQALHRLSGRAGKPFVVINCAAIPEALLEAELFGHTRGAFTGAVQSRIGRIEAARGGTLFLDEIGEIPLALQSKLLRFLESGELQRIGENEPIRVDVRVLAATHQPLLQQVSAGTFRSDLYFRLAVFLLQTPALAQRPEDIPALTAHFLDLLGETEPAKSLNGEAMEKLAAYHWPGNVRELAHVVERAYILAGDQSQITAVDICFA
ncbi:MAG: sigma-54 dependent transcriptional regulator [Acidobacteriaceae bacterium]